MSVLRPGIVLCDRFVIEASLASGGMGHVYRAEDARTGRAVAVKVILSADPSSDAAMRFEREIRVLSELDHPGIVAYVAHGRTDDGDPFLVMEYLEGEDLSARLARGRLGVAEALALAKAVAAPLDAAHRRGVVHRDLKPGNLFLRDRQVARVTLLDFGIARRPGLGRSLTRGGLIGTPEYMSPEQVRGEAEVGPPADIFALGCVLYECLAGRPPFLPDHPIATLAKILTEDPPSIELFCPDLPAALHRVLARMLQKDPARRYADAGALLAALSAVTTTEMTPRAPVTPPGLGASELQLVTVILATPRGAAGVDRTLGASEQIDASPASEAARREVAARGIPVERIGDGSLVVTLAQRGASAVDQAVEAAHCARLMRARWPDARITVATARGVAGARLPVGEALDRAAGLLGRGAQDARAPDVLLDTVTAALLDGRVRLAQRAAGAVLEEDATPLDESRPLLGKPTPCVGREQELGALTAMVSTSFEESTARAALVLGAPGLGKSRVRHELLRRLATQAEAPVLRLDGRGEPARAGTPYGVLGLALRQGFGIAPGDDLASARDKLLAGVERFGPDGEARAIAELLGELCDVPFADDESVMLRAARQDPRMMQARIGDAFVRLLDAAGARGGVLVVLEDLHWGDRRSLDLVEAALRELADRPLCVIAFARPEIHEVFPGLWKGRVTEMPLPPLGRRACERLVERVATGSLAPEVVKRIIEQSAGNALFLEELLRAACAGESEGAPATVLAMLQARIGRFDAGERRALRAASIFGEGFDAAGVSAILGAGEEAAELRRQLDVLVAQEILEPQRDGRGGHRFRHALMREAAYGLLTDADRRLGHRLAAAWLAEREHDPGLIAEHHLAAGDVDDALPWLLKAAQRAFDRDDFAATDRLAQRALDSGARRDTMGALLALGAFAAVMRWDWSTAATRAAEALATLRPGTIAWCQAQRVIGQIAAYRNDLPRLGRALETMVGIEPEPEARLAYGDTALHFASAAAQVGMIAEARRCVTRAEHVLVATLDRYPLLAGWLDTIRSTVLRHTTDDLGAQIRLLDEAQRRHEAFDATTSARVLATDILGEVLCRAGAITRGTEMIRGALRDSRGTGVGFLITHAQLALANALAAERDVGAAEEAEALAAELLATRGISSGYQAMARDVIAQAHLTRGDFAAAEREAREAVALSPHTPVRRWLMAAHLAEAQIGSGCIEEGFATAMENLREMDQAGGGGYAELALVSAAMRAAERRGEVDLARDLRARVQRWIEEHAAGLPEDLREGYLRRVTPR